MFKLIDTYLFGTPEEQEGTKASDKALYYGSMTFGVSVALWCMIHVI